MILAVSLETSVEVESDLEQNKHHLIRYKILYLISQVRHDCMIYRQGETLFL